MADSGIRLRLQQQAPIPLDVQLHCASGELLALVGPSGSGKTTILRAIAGLCAVRHAHIECQGEIWQNSVQRVCRPVHERHVGLVFQNYALFPNRTVLDNVILALTDLPADTRREQAQSLLQKVNLQGLEQRYPKALSGGQQQRVAVARALARRPKVLLLDEPFSAVDQVTRRKLYRELLALRETLSMPIILVTHDLEESAMLADRMALLYKGAILQSGTPDRLAAKPATALVARLMAQQNLFTAQVIGHDHDTNSTRLRWRGMTLEAALQTDFDAGERVCWVIQPSAILLHRRDRPSNGERENPLRGTIQEYMESGGLANLLVEVDRKLQIKLAMNVPLHVARRNRLQRGERIGLTLLAEGIHLMPYQPLRRTE